MGRVRAAVAAVVAVVGCAVAGCAGGADPGGAQGWRRLPESPIGPRTSAVVVGVGDRVLVVGGWEHLCPPLADCAFPEEPLLRDGAVYDRAVDGWRRVSPPPFGMIRTDHGTAALGGSAYVLTPCADGPECTARPRLLGYHLARDRWTDHGPVPGPAHHRRLVAVGDDLLAYSGSDEGGEVADLVFDPERAAWTPLPDDPLPHAFDRFVVPVGERLVLTGSSTEAVEEGVDAPTLAARLDLPDGRWVALPDAPGQGYQLLPTDRGPLLNGHFIGSPGWLLDPGTWSWSELPARSGDYDLAGVLDRERAVYDIPNSVGQVASQTRLLLFDSADRELVAVPAPPGREDVHDDSSTALGRDLFVFGGQRWTGDGPAAEGELVADPRLWTAPGG